ncbi:hypothetical protein [Arcicella rosea]|uniref:Tat (Twin-arginine translocation) pathway signal sequence n=1 Tax=Arcicella rosea TaxID=502909 RepID=A0A841EKV9_9BACT|nr:hypothetical protein [Arcicella rosea]MBB6003576.1 hypothetical protein [Arcicella rosea]
MENLAQNHSSRREFMGQLGLLTAASFLPETVFGTAKPHFEISLAESSKIISPFLPIQIG